MFSSVIAISMGASAGAILRWQLGVYFNQLWSVMPLGTLLANLIGGLLVGIAVPWFSQQNSLAPEWRLLLITGFLGGLTTFSTFSAEVIQMVTEHRWQYAMTTAATHLVGSLTLTGMGYLMVRFWVSK